MLNEISIKGYRSIKDQKLDLKALNILVGSNGSGKSNFLSVFRLLNKAMGDDLQNFAQGSGGARHFFYQGLKFTKNISIRLSFGDNQYEMDLEYSAPNNVFFSKEEVSFQNKVTNDKPFIKNIASGNRETNLKVDSNNLTSNSRGISLFIYNHMKEWTFYHFHDTSNTSLIKQSQKINDYVRLRYDGSNLAACLMNFENFHPDNYAKILETIRLVAPFFRKFDLHPIPNNPNQIILEWKMNGCEDEYFDATDLSDGTIRFMCLVTALLQPNPPPLIILDEPELGLHPYAINILAELINTTKTKTQLIIATQSPTLINYFEPEDLIITDYKNEQTIFSRKSTEELQPWLEDYCLGDIWEKNIFGGNP